MFHKRQSANRPATTGMAMAERRLRPTILLGAMLLFATATPSSAQSYDPDLGAGNTAPPGITYGGGLREGGYGDYRRYRSVFSHRAQVLPHRAHYAKHRHAR